MKDNTFKVIKNGNEHIGSICGIQIQCGCPRKYYLHMSVNEEYYSIYFNHWFTLEELQNIERITDFAVNDYKLITM
jgi:hypothetical protein